MSYHHHDAASSKTHTKMTHKSGPFTLVIKGGQIGLGITAFVQIKKNVNLIYSY